MYLLCLAWATDTTIDRHPAGRIPASFSARVFVGAAALVLVGVAALRWRVGADYWQYVRNYDAYKASFFTDLRSFNEPGIKGIAWLVSLVHDEPTVFLGAASILTIALMLWTITRYSIAIGLSYLLFVFVGTWHGSFNGVRQFLACAIVLAGHRFILDRKWIKYLLVVVIAASFHFSALAMLGLYAVPNRRLRLRTVLVVMATAVAALYASDAALTLLDLVKDDFIVTDYVMRSIHPLRVAVALLPVLLYWSPGVRTEADGEWFYRNIAVVHAAVMLAASWSAYMARFGLYTTAFLPLLLPRLIDFPDRRLTFLVRSVVVILYSGYWYIEVSSSSALNSFRFVFYR